MCPQTEKPRQNSCEGGCMNFNLNAMMQTITTMLTTVGLKILGAIAIWIVGRWLIGLALRLIGGALTRQKIDPTLIRYIHSAVSGLLSNFAGGVFLVILQPFKVGDFITAAGVTGTVEQIGLFASTVNTPDNVKTMIGNGKIFGDTIQNFSANPFRRVDLTAQLAHAVDPQAAIALLKPALAQVPNVMTVPAPDVE